MNVQDIVTRVRRTFGDEAAVQVQDADIIRWINDGQSEIIKRNDGALQQTAFINLVVNQQEYTLPTDLLLLRSLRYKFTSMTSYSALKYRSIQQFDESIDGWDGSAFDTGSPEFFTQYNGKVILFPIPSENATNGLKLLYNQKPTDVTSLADTPSLPLVYHNTLVQYCMYQASLLDEDHEVAVMHQTNFQDSVRDLINRETSDPTATYQTITVLDYDL